MDISKLGSLPLNLWMNLCGLISDSNKIFLLVEPNKCKD